jgi:hypothetical protein
MTTMAARDIRDISANSRERTVHVSIFSVWELTKTYYIVAVLDEVKNDTHQGYPVLGVEACGTENNSSVAWVEVENVAIQRYEFCLFLIFKGKLETIYTTRRTS